MRKPREDRRSDEAAILGKQLMEMRKTRGWNQKDAAAGARLSAGYLSQIERGLRNPPDRIIVMLANIYGESPEPLLRLRHPDLEVKTVTTPQSDADWRAPNFSYQNALNDPTFRYVQHLERREVSVTKHDKEFVAEIYSAIWAQRLGAEQVERQYRAAVSDPQFESCKQHKSKLEPSFEVKRAIAELYMMYCRGKSTAEGKKS